MQAQRAVHRGGPGALVAVAVWAATWAGAEVIDRILAVVGGHPVMLSDVRAAIDLGLVDTAGADDPIAVALGHLVDRQLMLSEVERYGPAAPADEAVRRALDEIVARAGEPRYRAALARGGLTEASLEAIVHDTLRIDAYVSQRFGASAEPTDDEVARAYTLRRDDLAVDGRVPTLSEAAPRLRAELTEARRAAQVADWLESLRRRTEVRLLHPVPDGAIRVGSRSGGRDPT